MFKSFSIVVFVLLMVLPASTPLWATDIPVEPYVEVFLATAGALSLFSSPDGGGNPFTEAFDQQGQSVDGTITIILYDDQLPWGNPVPFYPQEDIWLVDLNGDLVACQGGTIPDGDTDANGMTSWTNPLQAGGHVEPVAGNQLAIMVTGWILVQESLSDFRINSADLNSDRIVNLIDVVLFTSVYFGSYEYACDFHWDGVLNLSDIVQLARSMGAECF